MFLLFSIFTKSIKIILGFIEFVLAFLLSYLMMALTLAIIPVAGENKSDDIELYVKTNGVHTDICLPVNTVAVNWTEFIPPSDFPQVNSFQYISFGWGDKGFFLDTPTWDDLTFSTAFTAAFLPSETAMHVQYLEQVPDLSPMTGKQFISLENYYELTDFIKNSFKLDASKEVDLIPNKGYWKNDNFYEANGSYHLFNTCNAWTNKALKIAGVRTAFLALFSNGIMRHLNQ